MKTKLFILALTIGALLSCTSDNINPQTTGKAIFVVNQTGPVVGKIQGDIPTVIIISLEDETGKSIFENKAVPVTVSGSKFSTGPVDLPRGKFTITKFFVLSDDKLMLATPREGSSKSSLIERDLPILFNIGSGTTTEIAPPSIRVAESDTPESFGYTTFGFEIVEDPNEESEYMSIRVKFEPTVGAILYENADADFAVVGYDEDNSAKWFSVFPYTGPRANDLQIKSGYHHYAITASKWGITDLQTITGAHLLEGRVREGTIPTTYVFSGSIAPKRLSSYSTYFPSSEGDLPQNKTTYTYNSEGDLSHTDEYTYDAAADRFTKTFTSDFDYANGLVQKITTRYANTNLYGETTYTYQDDELPGVIRNTNGGVTTVVTLTYTNGGRTINALYNFSNGNSFTYDFVNEWRNLKSDKTNRGGQLCSQGTYVYDKNINPFKHLGYVDYLLRNFSIGNRTSEQVTYLACSYPSIIPESTSYDYDDDGYPVTSRTTYKGSTHTSHAEYQYE